MIIIQDRYSFKERQSSLLENMRATTIYDERCGKGRDVTVIEKLGILGVKILIILYRAGKPLYLNQLLRRGDISRSAVYRALSVLSDFRLVEYRYEYNRRFIVLTPEGRQVAELLYKADEIVRKVKGVEEVV